ncbi:hypothetical protein SDRG_08688 [Saprolegnia diclina VS20]|uniref:Uncharacterized protein n=1 Tax=Saprolegnia diclina (strain VS20) TaxID=1156394 RepID=T0QIN1_SAPDV|nr:hypothetical protein SDRG_08688 [Saprolegnia diclina VS20]EQC33580.1 hypothetical protein SDRG_08688 [Saprolegnia diclina VS20]|eukprot:XP_008612803.1 hypothetical protein SDRG_08688 [Saprolegnia diclina VS20]
MATSDRSGGARRSDPKHKKIDRARSAPAQARKPSSYGPQAHPRKSLAHARKMPAHERKVPCTPRDPGHKPPSRAHTPPDNARVAKPKRDKYGDIEPAPPTPAEQTLMDRIMYDRNDWKQVYLAAYMARNFLNGASSLGDPSPNAMAAKLEEWLGTYLTRTFPLVRAMSKFLKETTRATDHDRHIHLVFTMAAKIAAGYVDELGDARGLSEDALRVPRLLANCALKELADSHCLKHRLPGGVNTMRHTILGRKALDVDMTTERGRLALYTACLGENALDAATRESFGPLIAMALSQRAAGVRVVASFTSYMHVAQDMPRDGRFVALTVCRHKPPVDGAKDIEVEFEESLAGLFHEGTLVSFEFHGLSSGQWYAVSPGRIYPSFYCPCRRVSIEPRPRPRPAQPRRQEMPSVRHGVSHAVASMGAAFSSDDENEEKKAPPPAAAPKGILDIARKIQSPASLLLLQNANNDQPPARSALMNLLADAIPSTLVSVDAQRKRSRPHGSSLAERVQKMSRVEVMDNYGSDSEPGSTTDVGVSGHVSPASNDGDAWRPETESCQATPLSPTSSIGSTSSSRIDEHYDDGIGWNMDLASDQDGDNAPSLGPLLGCNLGSIEHVSAHPLVDGMAANAAGNDYVRELIEGTRATPDRPRVPLTSAVTCLVGHNKDNDEAEPSAALSTAGLKKVHAESAAMSAVAVDAGEQAAHDVMCTPQHHDGIHAPESLDDEVAATQMSASVNIEMSSTCIDVAHCTSNPKRVADGATGDVPDVQELASAGVVAPGDGEKEVATIDDDTRAADVAADNALCVRSTDNKVVTCGDQPTPTLVVPAISDFVDPEGAGALTQDANTAGTQAALLDVPINTDRSSQHDEATPLDDAAVDVLVPDPNHSSVLDVGMDTSDGGHYQAVDVTSAVGEDDASETEEVFVEIFEIEDSDDDDEVRRDASADVDMDGDNATADARGDEEDEGIDEFVEVFEILDDDDDDELLQDASDNGRDVNSESASRLLAVTLDTSVDALASVKMGGGTPADMLQGDDALAVSDADGDDALDVSDADGDEEALAAPSNAVRDSGASEEIAIVNTADRSAPESNGGSFVEASAAPELQGNVRPASMNDKSTHRLATAASVSCDDAARYNGDSVRHELAAYHDTIEIDDGDDNEPPPVCTLDVGPTSALPTFDASAPAVARANPPPNQVEEQDDDDASVVIEVSGNMVSPVSIQVAYEAPPLPSSHEPRVDEATSRDEQLGLFDAIDDAAVPSPNDGHLEVRTAVIDAAVALASETSPSPRGVDLPLDGAFASLPEGNSFLTLPRPHHDVDPPPLSPPPPPLPFLPPPGIDIGAAYAASSDDYNSISSSSSDEAPPPPPPEVPPLSPPRDMACVVRVKLPTAIKRQMIGAPKRSRPQPIYNSDMYDLEASASSPDDASDYEEGGECGPRRQKRPRRAQKKLAVATIDLTGDSDSSASIPPSTVSSSDSSSDESSEDDEGSEDEL